MTISYFSPKQASSEFTIRGIQQQIWWEKKERERKSTQAETNMLSSWLMGNMLLKGWVYG